MVVDQTTPILITSIVRLGAGLVILYAYFKNKNKITLFFSLFLLLFGIQGFFRLASFNGDLTLYFISKLALSLSGVLVLLGLSEIGVKWIKKYYVVPTIAIIFILLSYYSAYILGGVAGEANNSFLSTLINMAIGIVLLLAGYCFYILGKNLPKLGLHVLVFGFALIGFVLTFSFLIIANPGVVYYFAMLGTLMVGVGWWLSLTYEEP